MAMTSIKRREEVAYSTQEMFALVDDIQCYSEFLPWCSKSEVLYRDIDEVHALLEISAAGMTKAFTTHNRNQASKMIEIRLVDGPFKHLEGFWRFDALDDGRSTVALDLEFEFAGKLLDFAFGPIFSQIANTLVDAFITRADAVYANS